MVSKDVGFVPSPPITRLTPMISVTTLPVTMLPVTILSVTTLHVTTLHVTTLPVTILPVTTLSVTTRSVTSLSVAVPTSSRSSRGTGTDTHRLPVTRSLRQRI
jgi:hypothetical protein